jgi:hypothetical protein
MKKEKYILNFNECKTPEEHHRYSQFVIDELNEPTAIMLNDDEKKVINNYRKLQPKIKIMIADSIENSAKRQNIITNITQEEINILKKFKNLKPELQAQAFEYIQTLLDTQEEKIKDAKRELA